jgi:hypothetical protein
MDFLKKHYEKILLGIVLAGLVGALVFLPFYIGSESEKMKNLRDQYINNPHIQPLTNLDLNVQTSSTLRLQSAYKLDFETGNKLFNPVDWQKGSDGQPVKLHNGNAVGIQAVVVTNITPLFLVITNISVTTNELGARYVIGVEKQAEKNPTKRRLQSHYVSLGDKPNDTFSLVEVKGADPANPDTLILKLTDSGELVSLAKDKPYRRVDSYSADFRYDPEKRNFHARRAGDKVSFNGTDYVVAEVNQNELILSDQSNQKKTSLPFTP